jgi:hypothetical protein
MAKMGGGQSPFKGYYTPTVKAGVNKAVAPAKAPPPPKRKPTEPRTTTDLGHVGAFYTGSGPGSYQVRQPTEPPTALRQPIPRPVPSPGVVAGSGDPRNIGGPSMLSTGGTPVNTGATGAAGGNLTDPLTGFAAGFRPEALQALMANPELVLSALMQQRGMNPTGGGAGLMQLGLPTMDSLAAVMPLAWGGNLPPNPSAPINWLAKMGQQAITPGGSAINFADVMNTLGGLGQNTSAFQSLFGTGMAPQDQVNAVKQIVYGAAQQGLPEFFQRAVQNQMNQAALSYLGGQYGSSGKPAGFNTAIPRFFG